MSRRIDKEEAAHLQYETEHTKPPKTRSVMVYMTVLVAAAFLLLLLAYIMQERTASTVEGLSQSVNSFQTIDQLVDDNRALQDEVDRLEAENADLENCLAQAQGELADASGDNVALSEAFLDASQKAQALNVLNQLRALYNNGSYKTARALLRDFPYDFDMETVLGRIVKDDLSPEELQHYDPLSSYQRIVKLLGS